MPTWKGICPDSKEKGLTNQIALLTLFYIHSSYALIPPLRTPSRNLSDTTTQKMSDRASFRSGSSGRGGGGRGGYQSRGGRGGAGAGGDDRKPRKENILDLAKYADKEITVKFAGGREVVGTLKGYDQLMNLVMDDVREVLRGQAYFPRAFCFP